MCPANSDAGFSPSQWGQRLEEAAGNPELLRKVLADLKAEMKSEQSFVHKVPAPDGLLKSVMGFFLKEEESSLQKVQKSIREELGKERALYERFRPWLPGEKVSDRLFLYLKDFGGEVKPDEQGIQFPGFIKYQGFYETREYRESYIFYLNEKFPGRDPANFHVVFVKGTGEIIIKRVYRMELPRKKGHSAAREVLAEMVRELVPDLTAITEFEVDNAANVETRNALLDRNQQGDDGAYALRRDADPAKTPLGHMMKKLALELELPPGKYRCYSMPFGMLKLEMFMKGQEPVSSTVSPFMASE